MKNLGLEMTSRVHHFILYILVFITPSSPVLSQVIPQEQRVLKAAVIRLKDDFDIAYSQGSYDSSLLRPLHRSLVRADAQGLVRPDLARKWKISSDGKSYYFCLPPLRFNDGKMVELEDIQYSFDRYANHDNFSIHSWLYEQLRPRVQRYQIKDDFSSDSSDLCFSVKLKIPYFQFIHLLASPHFSIVSKKSKSKSENMIGRFKVASIDKNLKFITYQARDSRLESYDRIELRAISGFKEAVREVQEGKLDVYLGISDYNKSINEEDLPEQVKLTYLDDLGTSSFAFNPDLAIFKDINFRKDIAHLFFYAVESNQHLIKKTLRYSPHLIPRGLMAPDYYKRSQIPFDKNTFISRWKGKIPPSNFDVVARFNQIDKSSLNYISTVLSEVGLKLRYFNEYTLENRNKVISGDYHIVFLTWAASFDRVDEFFPMIALFFYERFSGFQSVKQYFDELKSIMPTRDYSQKVRDFGRIVAKIEDLYLLVPMYETRTRVIHSKHVTVPKTKWRYLPDISEFERL